MSLFSTIYFKLFVVVVFLQLNCFISSSGSAKSRLHLKICKSKKIFHGYNFSDGIKHGISSGLSTAIVKTILQP